MSTAGRLFSCAIGCGFTCEDPTILKRCGKCKLVLYCCREHQVQHWKTVHKAECFPTDLNWSMQVSSSHLCRDLSSNSPGYRIYHESGMRDAEETLQGRSGVALFLGTNAEDGRKKIISQIWTMNNADDYQQVEVSDPPDLYLPPVPPALVQKADQTARDKPNLSLVDSSTKHLCVDYWLEFTEKGGYKLLELITSGQIFTVVLDVLFSTEGTERVEAVKWLSQLLRMANWREQHIPTPPLIQEQTKSVVGKTLTLTGGIELIYITDPVACFADPTKDQLDWFNGSTHTSGIKISQ